MTDEPSGLPKGDIEGVERHGPVPELVHAASGGPGKLGSAD